MKTETALTRRELLLTGVAVLGGGCLCRRANAASPAESTCCTTPELDAACLTISPQALRITLGATPCLAAKDTAARVIIPERTLDLVIVRTDKDAFVALDGRCTHAGRPLSYVRSRGLLQCNNFGHSLFRLDGQVYKGPAEETLKSFVVRQRDMTLEIELP